MKQVRSFVINRGEWLRGSLNSLLLCEGSKKMCCLGIYLKSCGIEDSVLAGAGSPIDIFKAAPLPRWLISENKEWNSRLVSSLIDANDDEHASEAQREERIIELFAKEGITVTFKGE